MDTVETAYGAGMADKAPDTDKVEADMVLAPDTDMVSEEGMASSQAVDMVSDHINPVENRLG